MKKSFVIKNSLGLQMYQDDKEAKKHFQTQSEKFKRYAKEILDHLPVQSGKLLDVGCGLGWAVAEAQRRGFAATGIDQAKPYIQLGRKILKVNLVLSSLENFSTTEKYDVIIMNHVLEHIKYPDQFLKLAHKLLVSGGHLLVVCPNINSLMFWIFKERWYGLQPAQHLWQFTGKSLPALVNKKGFKVNSVIINSLDYQPADWKRIIFWLLVKFANIIGFGDQVFVLARKT